MKIAFIGTHGTGKTSLCLETAAWFNRNSKHIDIVKEIATDSPALSINDATTIGSQLYILHTQIARELLAAERFHHVVADRSILDNYAYLKRKFGPHPIEGYLFSEWISTYDFQFLVPIHYSLIGTNIRPEDELFQRDIDGLVLKLLEEHDVSHHKLTIPDPSEGGKSFIEQVKETIRKSSSEEFPLD